MRVSRRGKNLKLIVDDDVAEGITLLNHYHCTHDMHDHTWREVQWLKDDVIVIIIIITIHLFI